MSDSEDVLSTAALWRAAGEQVAVATVTETWGSSPRPAGSQMAVTKSGKMAGSGNQSTPLLRANPSMTDLGCRRSAPPRPLDPGSRAPGSASPSAPHDSMNSCD